MLSISQPSIRFADLKSAYHQNKNILHLIRDVYGATTNEQLSILLSYDLQAGSYVRLLEQPQHREKVQSYASALATTLNHLEPSSLLEAGVGEGTTLLETAVRLSPRPTQILGFDLSWSRIHIARRHVAAQNGGAIRLFVGELEAIPLPNNSVDVAYTAHAIEPNHGREREILQELHRVACRYLVLLEPGYEFASGEARARMEHHGYCRGLAEIARNLGWQVVEHRPFAVSLNPLNPTALLIIEKSQDRPATEPIAYACPACKGGLVAESGHWFCDTDGLVYPTLRDVPCLSRNSGIIASKFAAA